MDVRASVGASTFCSRLAAKEFAMIDEFHAGLPGPTLPNRLMFHSATTHGDCNNNFWEQIKGHPQKPIYMAFEEVGKCIVFRTECLSLFTNFRTRICWNRYIMDPIF